MLQFIDRNRRISRILRELSTALAARRGLPMLVGTILIVLSGLCFGAVLPMLVMSDEVASVWLWLCLPLGILHLGLFVGFLGFMLAEPLGTGYRSNEQ